MAHGDSQAGKWSTVSRVIDDFDITPNDDLDIKCDGLWISDGGQGMDIKVVLVKHDDDSGSLYEDVQAGFYPLACRKVLATGTTCTKIKGLIIGK